MADTISNYHVSGNQAGQNAIQFNGPVYGNVHMPSHSDVDSCLRDFGLCNPGDQRASIEDSKDPIQEECYSWILHTPEYLGWKEGGGVLWVRGGPGKGKTMMALALTDRLSNEFRPRPALTNGGERPRPKRVAVERLQLKRVAVSYFFCQNASSSHNSAASVLSGLIYVLVDRNQDLMQHVRNKHKEAGKRTFGDAYKLRMILQDIYNDGSLDEIYFVIDALDECVVGLPELLNTIGDRRIENAGVKIKWLVTSRYRDEIQRVLRLRPLKVISLDSEQRVSDAVLVFIRQKVPEFEYDDPELETKVEQKLMEKAGDTFLWVALACKRLENVLPYRALDELERLPPGLEPLYDRMMDILNKNEEAEFCKEILRSVTMTYHPLHFAELPSVADLPTPLLKNISSLKRLVARCASFIMESGGKISFFHQSAKDYFVSGNGKNIFPSDPADKHGEIVHKCLTFLSHSLKMDVAQLFNPSTERNEPMGNNGIILPLGYACSYWVNHLLSYHNTSQMDGEMLSDSGEVYTFLKSHLLHWFEVLSILGRLDEAARMVINIQSMTKEQGNLSAFLADAYRFLVANFESINTMPLQIYCSALLFAPYQSLVRQQFKYPAWILGRVGARWAWGPMLRRFKNIANTRHGMSFSPDGKYLAAGTFEKGIRVWDVITGAELRTFGGKLSFLSVKFSRDGKQLVGVSENKTAWKWDTSLWDADPEVLRLSTVNMLEETVSENPNGETPTMTSGSVDWPSYLVEVAVSGDGTHIASLIDGTLFLWSPSIGGHPIRASPDPPWLLPPAPRVSFSPDGKYLVSLHPSGSSLLLWSVATMRVACGGLYGHTDRILDFAVSPDGKYLASTSEDCTIKLWYPHIGKVVREIAHKDIEVLAFSPDSKLLVGGTASGSLQAFDVARGVELWKFKGHESRIAAIIFAPDGRRLATSSSDLTVTLWDMTALGYYADYRNTDATSHSATVTCLTFSPDRCHIASGSGSRDNTVKIWDVKSGSVQKTLIRPGSRPEFDNIDVLSFSPDAKLLASAARKSVVLWDVSSGKVLHTFEHNERVQGLSFSPDGQFLVADSRRLCFPRISVWGIMTDSNATETPPYNGITQYDLIAFSPDGRRIACPTIRRFGFRLVPQLSIIDSRTGKREHQFDDVRIRTEDICAFAFSPDNKHLVILEYTIEGSEFTFWDPETWVEVGHITWDAKFVSRFGFLQTFRFSNDGKFFDIGQGQISATTPWDGKRRDVLLAHDKEWVTYNGKKIIRVSPDEPVECMAVGGNTVIFGHVSGLVSFTTIDFEYLDGLMGFDS